MNMCRLCGGEARETFRRSVLGKYDVSYERCGACGSLQTEAPYWLDEAYATHNLATADTGAVARSLICQAAVWSCARTFGLSKRASVIDIGGGNGLLCRLLRDCGFDAHLADKYATNDFARGFDDDRSTYDISCAFEVAEHLANPLNEFPTIVARSTALCVIGTETYSEQGPDWWYLDPMGGQHIFFYSRRGMAKLARDCHRHYLQVENYHIFLNRPFKRLEQAALSRILMPRRLRYVRAYLAYKLSFDSAVADATLSKLQSAKMNREEPPPGP